jgi:hypothetical protein
MKNYLSSKSFFIVIFLWCLVLFMLIMMLLNLNKPTVDVVPIIITLLVSALVIWILLDTRYVIKNSFLLYRSGPFRGRIDINKIDKVQYFSGLYPQVSMKPALDIKGYIITYNKQDDVYVSPKKSVDFIAELLKINPKIEVI